MPSKRNIVLCLFFTSIVFSAYAQNASFTRLSDFYSPDVLEQNVLKPQMAEDLSRYFLSVLFGKIGGLNGRNQIIADIFRLLNTAILGLMSYVIGYSVLASVIGSAQDGTGALSNRVHPTTLLRTGLGITLMAPLPQLKGYNLLQYLLMKVVLLGVGLANTTWLGVLAQIESIPTSTAGAGIQTESIDENYNNQIMSHLSELYLVALKHYIDSENPSMKFRSSMLPTSEQNAVFLDDSNFSIKVNPLHGSDPLIIEPFVPVHVKNLFLDTSIGTSSQKNEVKKIVLGYYEGMLNAFVAEVANQMEMDVAINYSEILGTESDEESKDNSATQSKKSVELARKLYRCPTPITNGQGTTYSCSDAEETRINNRLDKLSSILKQRARRFGQQMSELNRMALMFSQSSVVSEPWTDSARKQGWLSAGIYYQHISEEISKEANLEPTTSSNGISFSSFRNKLQGNYLILSGKEISMVPQLQGFMFMPTTLISVANEVQRVASKTIRDQMCDHLAAFAYRSTKRNTFDEIPQMWGKMGNEEWFMNIQVQKPLQYLVVMVGEIAQKLLGLNAVSISTKSDGVRELRPNGSCKGDNGIQDNSMFAAFEKNADVDPIKLVRDLGYKMIDQSVIYFTRTIEALYDETIKLADRFYGVTVSLKTVAAVVEASLHGSMFAYVANLVATALSIAVSGMQIAYNNTKLALEMFVPLGTGLASVFFTLGVILGVYLPMMPYILFVFSGIAWLMSVAEAMVATPLVALGIAHPEGHDLLGKSEQALILLLGVFVRPVTILLGLIMAIYVSKIVLLIFHLGFLAVASDVLIQAGTGATMGVILAGVAIVYIYVLISVIEQSYALIYQVPERILRWVGGPQDQTGVGQLAEQVKSETQQAASSAASGASQATSAGQISQDTNLGGQGAKQGEHAHDEDGGNAQAGGGGNPQAGGGGNNSQPSRS